MNMANTIVGRDGMQLARTGLIGAQPAVKPVSKIAAPAPVAKSAPAIRVAADQVMLGTFGTSAAPVVLDLGKLLDGRLLVQGVSGAGKSWTLRRLLEQSAGRIQRIVIDPEGEFRDLAEKTGMLHIEGHLLDGRSMAELARRVREHRISLVIDLSQATREEQLISIAAFFLALIEAPKECWHPALVAIDEAHLFAPFGGDAAASSPVRKAAIGAVVDLMSRGRKRGLAGVLATQRLARLSKSVASEVQNFLIGMNTLDLDVRRAAEAIGWSARTAFERLPTLEPGGFYATGPAFSLTAVEVRIGTVISQHVGARPSMSAPPASTDARSLVDLDALLEASATGEAFRARDGAGDKAVRAFLRSRHAVLATQIAAELRALLPKGATADAMVQHFKATTQEVKAAITLLEINGIVETEGGAARLSKGAV